MTIKKQIDIPIEDIAVKLNVDFNELMAFLNNKTAYQANTSTYTVHDVISAYLENLRGNRKSYNTKKRYVNVLSRFNSFVKTNYENLTIDRLNESIVVEFLALHKGRRGNSLTIGSQNNYTSVIKSLLQYAYINNYSNKNYSNKLSLINESKLPRYFSNFEIENIISESLKRVHGYRYHAIISVFLGTGCRVSELVNLRVSDINFEHNFIFVRKSKNNKERYIPLYPELKVIVSDFLKYTGVSESGPSLDGYLFSKDYGTLREKPLSIRAIQDICSKIFRKLNLKPELTVHSFRHTFAVRCLQVDMKIHNLSMILGHSNINTTYGYIQLFPADLNKEILNKYPFPLEKLVNKALY